MEVRDGKNGDDSGHVRVYRFNDTASIWLKLGEDIDGEAEADYSGSSLSLSSDGKTVAIGSPAGYDESCEGLHNGMIIVLRGRIVAAFEWGVSYVACCVILEGVLKPRYIYSYVFYYSSSFA